ncbi:FAD:protein FMN transferase [Thermodesulfobacteriota bacterium]
MDNQIYFFNMLNFNTFSKCSKIACAVIFVLVFAGCGSKKEAQISGKTMGTTYHIKVVSGIFIDLKSLEADIEKRLEEINRSMSTYMKDSEISRFNSETVIGKKVNVSDDFMYVMKIAEKLFTITGGAWDGTVKPLVDLWGFGGGSSTLRVPEKGDVDLLLQKVGFNHIVISRDQYLAKRRASVSIDLASIAKGYAVDQLAEIIRKRGIDHFLVEIGGEVFASGLREDGENWTVGINTPVKEAAPDQVYKAVALYNKAMATSGDYRIFFEIDGKRYAHIIDPRTGYPVANGVVSVSIVSDSCTFADGLATAVMVMGHKNGMDLINRLDNTEGFIVVQKKDGTLRDYTSSGFK